MKKYLLLIIAVALSGISLFAQTATRPATQPNPPATTGFKGVDSYVEKQEFTVEAKSLIPATGIFQDKTDTYQKSGDYKFTFDLDSLRIDSDNLLNKWLKESK